jgi:hypothetical protein
LGGCAAERPLATNSLARDLNMGGHQIERTEKRFELSKVEHLSETLPACLAYRLASRPPAVSNSLKDALRVTAATLKAKGEHVDTLEVFHARLAGDTAGAYPAETMSGITDALRKYFPDIKVRYAPVPKEQVRSIAVCGAKDTSFVVADRLTFYSRELPSDLMWTGRLHIADSLFMKLSRQAPRPLPLARTAQVPDASLGETPVFDGFGR